MTSESKITYDANGNAISFSGPDAVKVFQAAALSSGLGLMAKGIKPHRSWTSIQAALDRATDFTGEKYKGKKDITRARTDLSLYVQIAKQELDR